MAASVMAAIVAKADDPGRGRVTRTGAAYGTDEAAVTAAAANAMGDGDGPEAGAEAGNGGGLMATGGEGEKRTVWCAVCGHEVVGVK